MVEKNPCLTFFETFNFNCIFFSVLLEALLFVIFLLKTYSIPIF